MKFCEDSPNIPDELLIARDEGRVVFFCGAGVSMARAGLPSFLGLTKQVIKELKVQSDELAYEKLNEVKKGIGSADQVFGALEREFSAYNRQKAIARALKPSLDADLSCHQALLDLATTPEGKVKLVTTNFDRLFEDCDQNLPVWQPPSLPNPLQEDQMHGIVYLHGCVDKYPDLNPRLLPLFFPICVGLAVFCLIFPVPFPIKRIQVVWSIVT